MLNLRERQQGVFPLGAYHPSVRHAPAHCSCV